MLVYIYIYIIAETDIECTSSSLRTPTPTKQQITATVAEEAKYKKLKEQRKMFKKFRVGEDEKNSNAENEWYIMTV